MKKILFTLFIITLVAAGCGKTRVVLLPDDSGTVGKAIVSTNAGSETLDKANQYTAASSMSSAPDKPDVMNQDTINKNFGQVLNALPEKAVSFLLYFKFNSNDLTDESIKLIPDVMAEIKKREPCEISIIGHSDTMGAEDYNITLSLDRAKMVEKMLIDQGINISKMDVSSHGENDLIVKTGNNVSEPRNRCVEIMVR